MTLSSNCIMQLAQIYRPKKQKSEPDSPDFVSDCTRRNRFVWPDSLDLSRSLVCMNPRQDRKQTKNLQLRIQRISQTLFELNYIIYENCSMYTFLLHLSGIQFIYESNVVMKRYRLKLLKHHQLPSEIVGQTLKETCSSLTKFIKCWIIKIALSAVIIYMYEAIGQGIWDIL